MNNPFQPINPGLDPAKVISALKDFRQALPVRSHARDQALRALRHPQASAQRIADTISQDPALSLQLIFRTNIQLRRQGNEARYLHHCISLLGIPQVEAILTGLTNYDSSDQAYQDYEEQLNQSWLAADLCQQLQLGTEEESQSLFLSCLTIRFHELALWRHYPQEMRTIERLKASPLYNHDQVEERVLGITINKLGIHLAKHWPLPELAQICWQDGFHLNTKANPDSIHRPNCLKLCHVVSSLGCRNWFHRETLDAQHLLAKEARRTPEQVVSACRQSTLNTPLKGWQQLHPGNRLLQYWDYQKTLEPLLMDVSQTPPHKKANTSIEEKAPPAAEISHSELEQLLHSHQQAYQGDKKLLQNGLNTLIRRGHEFEDLNKLLVHSLNTLHHGLGLSDSAIMVLNNERNQLRTKYCHGKKDLLDLRIKLTPNKPALFEKLLQQRASILISQRSSAQIITQIPAELDELFEPEGLGFMSLFHLNQPVGILIAHSTHLDSERFQQFKKIGTATSAAISALAREKYRHRKASTA